MISSLLQNDLLDSPSKSFYWTAIMTDMSYKVSVLTMEVNTLTLSL